MSDWKKADGAKIQITFDQPLTSDVSGNQSHFVVSVPEYDMVPGGTLSTASKTVKSTAEKVDSGTINLSSGTLTDTELVSGKLSLGVA